jgi:serine/threonine protein kinase
MKACGLFSTQQPKSADEDVQMDGCQESPLDSATEELQQFMIMPRLGQNLEDYFESIKY